jgi:hypothetical protein
MGRGPIDIAELRHELQRFLGVLARAEREGLVSDSSSIPAPDPVVVRGAFDRLVAGANAAQLQAEQTEASRKYLLQLARSATQKGVAALRAYYKALSTEERALIEREVLEKLVPMAREFDERDKGSGTS